MSKILFFQYLKCSTCIKANKWLKTNQIEIDNRDIVENNPTREELDLWVKQSGLPIHKFFNTSGKMYRDLDIKEKIKTSSRDELLDILSSNGMLVKRPMLVSPNFILIGFKEDEWSLYLKQK